MEYRKDIDGLRAIAVLPVILYHFGFDSLSGGFLGVDVFFVISGFLISGIIYEEINAGKFSIVNFYERRFRRIVPALIFFLILYLPVSLVTLSPEALSSFGSSLMGVATFSSNFIFWLESGYFDGATELKPMIHTWSLAVEEQFYIFFPLLAMLLVHRSKALFLSSISLIFLVSLAIAEYSSDRWVSANFYFIITRAWELLAGVFCMLFLKKQWVINRYLSILFTLFGFLALLCSYFFFNEHMNHPSLITLIPVLATCFLIAFGGAGNPVSAFLSIRPLVSIGLISYSLYLVHQPIISTLNIATSGSSSLLLLVFGLISSFMLAYISWRFVESPFRSRNRISANSIFKLSLLSMLVVFIIGLFLYIFNGLPSRYEASSQEVFNNASPSTERYRCHANKRKEIAPEDACIYGGQASTAVFGDSHAVELAYSLSEQIDGGVVHLTYSGCEPYSSRVFTSKRGCGEWTESVINYLTLNKSIETVYVVYRINKSLFGDHRSDYPDFPAVDLVPERERMRRWNSVIDIMERLQSAGKKVVWVKQPPELPIEVSHLIAINVLNGSSDKIIGVSRVWWDERSRFINTHSEDIPKGVVVVDPTDYLCDSENCYAVINGKAMYFDDDHLSVQGAGYILDAYYKNVDQ